MAKQITPISINNRTFKINTFHVEVVALKYFNTSFADASDETKAKIKNHIRIMLNKRTTLSAQIIEDNIVLSLLSKNLQKEVKSLAYLNGF